MSTHLDEWTQKAKAELKGKDPSSGFMTPEGITLERFYSPHNAEVPDHPPPGVYPYARGPYATMYTARPWTVRQYAGKMLSWCVGEI
jgi:methylmalonyl-CoA mutase